MLQVYKTESDQSERTSGVKTPSVIVVHFHHWSTSQKTVTGPSRPLNLQCYEFIAVWSWSDCSVWCLLICIDSYWQVKNIYILIQQLKKIPHEKLPFNNTLHMLLSWLWHGYLLHVFVCVCVCVFLSSGYSCSSTVQRRTQTEGVSDSLLWRDQDLRWEVRGKCVCVCGCVCVCVRVRVHTGLNATFLPVCVCFLC